MNREIHTRPNHGATDEWLTPPEIIHSLGRFDLDPCAHRDQFYRTAKQMISPPEDGLAVKWRGRVWLNPPYGAGITLWLKRLAKHGNGIALVPARTEVQSWFWPYIWEAADAVFFFRGRLSFLKPDGKKLGNAAHGSVLVAYGARNRKALEKCEFVGKYIRLRQEVLFRE